MIDDVVNAINSSFVGEPTPQEAVLRQGIEALNEGNQPIYRTQSRGLFRGSEEILDGQTWTSVNQELETIANETINDQPTHFAFNAMLLMNEIEYQTAVADGNLDLARTNRNNKAEIFDRMKRVLYAVAEGVDLPNTPHYESSRTKVVRDIADIARKGGNPHEAFDLLGNQEITQDKNENTYSRGTR